MKLLHSMTIAASVAAMLLLATPAEACRLDSAVQIFHETAPPAPEKDSEIWRVRITKFPKWRRHHPAGLIEAIVLEGSSRGRKILIASPRSGHCSFAVKPDWGSEAWLSGHYMRFSNGNGFEIDGTPVIEAHDQIK